MGGGHGLFFISHLILSNYGNLGHEDQPPEVKFKLPSWQENYVTHCYIETALLRDLCVMLCNVGGAPRAGRPPF